MNPSLTFSYKRYLRKLSKPVDIYGAFFHEREGFIIELKEGPYSGQGECAPLPESELDLLEPLEEKLAKHDSFLNSDTPLIQWALDMAFWNLQAQRQHVPLSVLLNPHAAQSLQSNALLSDLDDTALLKDFEEKKQAGYQCFKIKCGRKSPEEDIKRIRHLALQLPKGGYFRLDANRSWDLATAYDIAISLRGIPIAYIEEPLKNPFQLPEFCKQSGYKVALDESIYINDFPLISFEGLAALIIKPTRLESLPKTLQLLHLSKLFGIDGVISSCYESVVGLRFLVELAKAFSPGIIAGLDTE